MGSHRWGTSRAASDEAVALGHHWFGEEHFLLAFLASDPAGDQQQALAALGLTHDTAVSALAARLERDGPPLPKQYEGVLSSASYHSVLGRAEGIALGLGDGAPAGQHYLPAVLWDAGGIVAALLADLGIPRVSALDAVGDLGVQLAPNSVPNPLLAPSERQALTQQHAFISGWDIVLALLIGEPDDRAKRFLEDLGLTHERAVALARERDERYQPPVPRSPEATTAAPSPVCRQLLGRAEGLAATIGDGTVRSTDALVAYLWAGDGQATIELETLSVSALAVVAALVDAGIRVPAAPLPEPDRTPWGEPVDVPKERLRDVIMFLKSRLPLGSWGCNTHEERAWVIAHADIDLEALVDEALADA